MQTLKFDEFIRSLKQNRDTTHSLLFRCRGLGGIWYTIGIRLYLGVEA